MPLFVFDHDCVDRSVCIWSQGSVLLCYPMSHVTLCSVMLVKFSVLAVTVLHCEGARGHNANHLGHGVCLWTFRHCRCMWVSVSRISLILLCLQCLKSNPDWNQHGTNTAVSMYPVPLCWSLDDFRDWSCDWFCRLNSAHYEKFWLKLTRINCRMNCHFNVPVQPCWIIGKTQAIVK